MKISRQEPQAFCPIQITLENVNEALMLGEALRAYQGMRTRSGFSAGERTPKDFKAESLLDALVEMGY